MRALDRLRAAADAREETLRAEVAAGAEAVGLPVPLAPPAEIVEAAGARPFRLLAAGGADADVAGLALLSRDACGYCRSVFGAAVRRRPPVTALAAGTTCDRLRRGLEALAAATGLPLYPLALPRVRGLPGERESVAAELRWFAREMSVRTGREVAAPALGEAIRRANEVRSILATTDSLRRRNPPLLTGLEYLDVVRASGLLPSATFLAAARGLAAEAAARPAPAPRAARVLLVGPTVADGRREALEFLEADGRATVVADLTDSGALAVGPPVAVDGDLFLALADAVLSAPALAAPVRPAAALRRRFAEGLSAARAEGVLFRGLPFCRPWNAEAAALRDACPVPFLDVRADGTEGLGALRTRIEAFVETLAARRGRAEGGA